MRRLTMLVVPPALFLAGCGGGGGETTRATTGNVFGVPAVKVAVTLSDFRIEPATIKLAKAGVYTFVAKNAGTVTHVFELESNDLESETAEIPPGKTGQLTLRLHANRYKMYCPLDHHEAMGMKGTLVVG